MMLQVPIHHSDKFIFVGKTTFTAELSDFNTALFGRVWDDACDVGFEILSARTGRKELFILDERVRTNGEIAHWIYKPFSKFLLDNGIKVVIFND